MLGKQCGQIDFHDIAFNDGDIVVIGKRFAKHRNQCAVDFYGDDLFIHFAKVLRHGADTGTDFQNRILGCGSAFFSDALGNHGID